MRDIMERCWAEDPMARPAFALFGILAAWIAIPRIFWPVCEVALRVLFPEYF